MRNIWFRFVRVFITLVWFIFFRYSLFDFKFFIFIIVSLYYLGFIRELFREFMIVVKERNK